MFRFVFVLFVYPVAARDEGRITPPSGEVRLEEKLLTPSEQMTRVSSEGAMALSSIPSINEDTPQFSSGLDVSEEAVVDFNTNQDFEDHINNEDGELEYQQGYQLRWQHGKPDEAFELYKQAADKGHIQAMHEVAVMALKGIGIPQDLETAFEEYTVLADVYEDPSACNILGLMYLDKQLPQSEISKYVNQERLRLEKAKELFERGEKGGDMLAAQNKNTAEKALLVS